MGSYHYDFTRNTATLFVCWCLPFLIILYASLVPRPFGGGGEKMAQCTLSAHASKCTENPGTS